MTVSTRPTHAARAGFTLIELLVVLGIIGALIAITLGIGSGMIESGKARQTADTIKALDALASEHRAATDGGIPWNVMALEGNTTYIIPLLDGVDRGDTFNGAAQSKGQIPTLAWYLKSVTEYAPVASADALLAQIDGKLKQIEINTGGASPAAILETPPGKRISILDAWGRPIRMVHPKLDGVIPNRGNGQIANDGGPMQAIRQYLMVPQQQGSLLPAANFRRNYVSNADRAARKSSGQPYMFGDSDGGSCQGDVPYFYSTGRDGDASTRSDNVYSVRPKFADPD